MKLCKTLWKISQMDDLLKPTSVPLEAETVLWLEFLLNPSLLTTHLQKENASKRKKNHFFFFFIILSIDKMLTF